jgi:hypothetical protein
MVLSLANLLKRKDCRPPRVYSTISKNHDESFLPINYSISPDVSSAVITNFLKVSPTISNSFESIECIRPDDYCCIVKGAVKFNYAHGNL